MKVTTERLEQVLRELKVEKSTFMEDFNLSKQNWQHWRERGLPGNRLITICGYLGISLDDLTGTKSKKKSDQLFISDKSDRRDIHEHLDQMPDNLLNSIRIALMYIEDVGEFKWVRKSKKKAPLLPLSKQS
jgi:glycyl-tRNA synthetase beta subunit